MKKIIKIIVLNGIYLIILAILVLKVYNLKIEEVNKLKIDLNDKREIIYKLDQEKQELIRILDSYTINERKGSDK